MDKVISINATDGTKLEMTFEEEDGATFIEVKDWDTGDVVVAVEYGGDLGEFKRAVALL